ncbi:uncharacterized protein CTRU02_211790 [Colletotrichum truncatum]|uniref:Uncharacterized protein n=1 Tax=Colletotrichum truncatum TaxID=5467 RepID=A0ACC3YLY5_COLTU
MGKIRRSNIVAQAHSNVKIHDINGHEDKFTFAQSGFQFFHIPVDVSKWTEDSAKNQYLPAMEKWLMDYFKAKKVHIYTYTYRCENRERTASESWIGPYMRAHCDSGEHSQDHTKTDLSRFLTLGAFGNRIFSAPMLSSHITVTKGMRSDIVHIIVGSTNSV